MTAAVQGRNDLTIEQEIKRIFERQGAALQAVRNTTAGERLDKLRRLQAVIERRAGDVFAALAIDLGKPQEEAVADFGAPLWEIGVTEAGLEEWMAPKTVSPTDLSRGATARIEYQPKGRVLIFAPWNYPFGLALQPLVAAIAAGNTAILKPSELAPATSTVIAEIVRECFDESEAAVVEGGPEVARALLDYPFDHIFFTGSTNNGRKVMAAAAHHLASVTLELGGKSPVIIENGFDPVLAAQRIAVGKFGNAGQVCVAPDHVWIAPEKRDAFVAEFLGQISARYYDNGTLREEALAHIIDQRNVSRLRGLIDDATSRGARVVQGGMVDGLRIEPTVLIDVPLDAAIMKEEIFGPILPVLTYSDTSDVLDAIAGMGKPLALYVFSDHDAFVDDILSRTSSGGVTVNDVVLHPTEARLPFGGTGSSGMGAYHGVYSFLELSHHRAVYVQGAN